MFLLKTDITVGMLQEETLIFVCVTNNYGVFDFALFCQTQIHFVFSYNLI